MLTNGKADAKSNAERAQREEAEGAQRTSTANGAQCEEAEGAQRKRHAERIQGEDAEVAKRKGNAEGAQCEDATETSHAETTRRRGLGWTRPQCLRGGRCRARRVAG